MAKTLHMVMEHFKVGDAIPVYRRFRDRGRLAPPRLSYLSSWVDKRFECCYQLMETDDPQLLDAWMARWSDIVDFELHPVMTSVEAAETIHRLIGRSTTASYTDSQTVSAATSSA